MVPPKLRQNAATQLFNAEIRCDFCPQGSMVAPEKHIENSHQTFPLFVCEKFGYSRHSLLKYTYLLYTSNKQMSTNFNKLFLINPFCNLFFFKHCNFFCYFPENRCSRGISGFSVFNKYSDNIFRTIRRKITCKPGL